MWPWPRARRDLPQVNYNEDTDDEEFEDGLNFNSPLQSPAGPVHTRAGSPVLLAHPTLNDNVDDVLEEVSYALHDHNQVREEVEELTSLLEQTNTRVGSDPLENSEITKSDASESVIELNLKVSAVDDEVGADNSGDGEESEDEADTMVNYDTEDKEDGDKAQDLARSIKVEFDASDIRFWFAQLEDEMEMAGVGKQWLKKSVLQRNLPVKQKEDVKGFLTLQKADAGNHIYYDIKTELIRINAPKPQDAYNKALSRTMTGLPSQLGYKIIDDICRKPTKLDGCCCAGAALAIWSNQLPVQIRAHISQRTFTKETYKEVFEAADQVFNSSKQVSVAAMALDETLPAFTAQNQPSQVAAVGRGNRGGQSGTARGANQRGRGRGGRASRGGGRGKPRGPRHSSMPPEACCDRHYVHGDQAWYCLAPLTCPWVSKVTAAPK